MRVEHKTEMKSRQRNIALTVAYDGTNYHGFQRQSPPTIAIQNILEDKLQKIFGDTIELAAAGRTDAGVHALGQVVNFFTDGTIPIDKIPLASIGVLPDDIVVRDAKEVD
ncbi:MAG: tRNA pseudouridine(38-40) synthase TruA, partial [Selenomonadaceae bacterium]|nr:tRNA pseudouridine(38-40) synthase TruA [Selenomonadaceae bacterium]